MAPLIFVEYVRRDRTIPWPIFRYHGRQDWQGEGDVMVANLARTMKVGPEPHTMCWWRIPSLGRMDEWEAHFRTPEGAAYMANSPVARALDFYQCGLFDILVEGVIAAGKLHLAEFFASNGAEPAAITDFFAQRAAKRPEAHLAFLVERLGLLGPAPGGIAVWSFADYASSEPFLRDPPLQNRITLACAGFYRNFGEDIA